MAEKAKSIAWLLLTSVTPTSSSCRSACRSDCGGGSVIAVIGDGLRGRPTRGAATAKRMVSAKPAAMAGRTICPPTTPISQPPSIVAPIKATDTQTRICA